MISRATPETRFQVSVEAGFLFLVEAEGSPPSSDGIARAHLDMPHPITEGIVTRYGRRQARRDWLRASRQSAAAADA